ncbi:hypothetical protein DWZ35_20565 [Bacteroides caccae]|nr:hypothetical protein DWZ35_20565 [Bacteroides caccae]
MDIASPMYFRKWINYLENKHNSKVIFYKAKSKELGWRKLSTRIEYANGEADVIAGHDNPWLMMQYKVPEICRPSCFECSFKGFPRTSDITMGDLWAKKGSIPQNLDGDLGTSIVLQIMQKEKLFCLVVLRKWTSIVLQIMQKEKLFCLVVLRKWNIKNSLLKQL